MGGRRCARPLAPSLSSRECMHVLAFRSAEQRLNGKERKGSRRTAGHPKSPAKPERRIKSPSAGVERSVEVSCGCRVEGGARRMATARALRTCVWLALFLTQVLSVTCKKGEWK